VHLIKQNDPIFELLKSERKGNKSHWTKKAELGKLSVTQHVFTYDATTKEHVRTGQENKEYTIVPQFLMPEGKSNVTVSSDKLDELCLWVLNSTVPLKIGAEGRPHPFLIGLRPSQFDNTCLSSKAGENKVVLKRFLEEERLEQAFLAAYLCGLSASCCLYNDKAPSARYYCPFLLTWAGNPAKAPL
jgi:hypothetical protein